MKPVNVVISAIGARCWLFGNWWRVTYHMSIALEKNTISWLSPNICRWLENIMFRESRMKWLCHQSYWECHQQILYGNHLGHGNHICWSCHQPDKLAGKASPKGETKTKHGITAKGVDTAIFWEYPITVWTLFCCSNDINYWSNHVSSHTSLHQTCDHINLNCEAEPHIIYPRGTDG